MRFTVGIVDDHQLFTGSLEMMLNSFKDFHVTLTARSGLELRERLSVMGEKPDIILIDVSLPDMNGIEIAAELNNNYPDIKLAALTTTDEDKVILSMIKAGCCSYMLKNIHPAELEKGMLEIAQKGYYNSDWVNINFGRLIQTAREDVRITERELQFLELACTDLTYKAIASKMGVVARTVDGYRDNLFKKLNVVSRAGMVREAMKRGIVNP